MVNCIQNGCFDGSQCDVNEDGSLDVFDIILTINCILDDCPLNAIEIYPGQNIQEIVDTHETQQSIHNSPLTYLYLYKWK